MPQFGNDRVILPLAFADMRPRDKKAVVGMLTATQFARVPRLAVPDIINFREEDRINAYYAGGYLYSKPLEKGEKA